MVYKAHVSTWIPSDLDPLKCQGGLWDTSKAWKQLIHGTNHELASNSFLKKFNYFLHSFEKIYLESPTTPHFLQETHSFHSFLTLSSRARVSYNNKNLFTCEAHKEWMWIPNPLNWTSLLLLLMTVKLETHLPFHDPPLNMHLLLFLLITMRWICIRV